MAVGLVDDADDAVIGKGRLGAVGAGEGDRLGV